ncbi:hypothetical protein OIU78_005631 [Salix suchowensis]|nr:hypothetical protein OIU78_005631 [Salix suchowensis]
MSPSKDHHQNTVCIQLRLKQLARYLLKRKISLVLEGFKKQGVAYGGFDRCAIALFEASGRCMKQSVCSLYLKKVGADDWRPGWVKVLHRESSGALLPVSYMLNARTFVPENVRYGLGYCDSKEGFMPHVATFET